MPAFAHQTRHAIQGALWLLLLLALALAIFFLDEVVRATREQAQLVVVMAEAEKVRRGHPVWLAGYAVGKVRSIDFLPPSADTLQRMAVTVEIPEEHLAALPRGSYARVRVPRPLADPVIDLIPGGAGRGLRPGDTLRARPSVSTALLTAKLSSARTGFDSLRTSLAEAARATDPEALERRLRLTLAALEAVRAEGERLAEGVSGGPLRRALTAPDGLRADVAGLRERIAAIRLGIGRRTGAFGADGGLGPAMRDARASFEQASRNLARLDSMIVQGDGLPGRLQRDTALLAAIRSARLELDSLVADVKRRPLRYLF